MSSHYDGFANITTVTGQTAGLGPICTARFDPFGNPVNAQSSIPDSRNACNTGSTLNDFFYRGGRQDPTSGDYQFGSRTYDPSKGTYLTPDSYRGGSGAKNVSVGTDPLTENRYSYVNGDPINLSDPDGHCSCSMSPDAQHCDPAGTDPNGNALVECGNAQSENWHYDKDAPVPHDIHGLTADIYQTRDFLQTIGSLARGCVTSWSGVAGCAGAVAALAGQEEIAAGLFAASGAPAAVNCVEHPNWSDCLTAGVSLLPAGGLAGKAVIGRLFEANASDAFARDLAENLPPSTPTSAPAARFPAPSEPAILPTAEGPLAAGPGAALRNGAEFFPRLSENERATLGRLWDRPDFANRMFEESPHVGAEVLDELGRSYDFLGNPRASQFWNPDEVFGSITDHLLKSNDFTVVDLTGFAAEHSQAVQEFLRGLSEADQARIISIGP